MGEMRHVYKILVGKPEERRPLGISKCRWEDIIKMDLEEIGWEALTGCIKFRIETSSMPL
jgi:hypothetical protein